MNICWNTKFHEQAQYNSYTIISMPLTAENVFHIFQLKLSENVLNIVKLLPNQCGTVVLTINSIMCNRFHFVCYMYVQHKVCPLQMSKSKSKSNYDRRSVGQCVLVSFYLFLKFKTVLDCNLIVNGISLNPLPAED
jgi:hypothetical protein